MPRLIALLVCILFSLAGYAQEGLPLASVLNFEAPHTGPAPAGWGVNPAGCCVLDSEVVHGGKWSARIERAEGAAGPFSGISRTVPVDFGGERVELRGFIRTQEVKGFVAIWLRADAEGPTGGSLGFDTIQPQHIDGTRDWKSYSISVELKPNAAQLVFGFLLNGTGKAWVDDLELVVDGTPVWNIQTVVDTDHEFDAGSGISISQLSPAQIDNLATLAKVWGFLKYHHPQVTSGRRQWDYDLFRVMPAVLAASDRAAANAAISKWIEELGPVAECKTCSQLKETELQLRPELGWMQTIGDDLGKKLEATYRNRPAGSRQFYVSFVPGVGNPVFQHELNYERAKLPDAGFRLLALFRQWNIIRYWYPYRDVIGEDWNRVLAEFIPRLAGADTAEGYKRELIALIARVHDTHANLWNGLDARPPVGACQVPAIVRFVDKRPVVAGFLAEAPALHLGDVIESMDGVPVSQWIERWKPYYAASNEPTVLRDMARAMLHGECGDAKFSVRRGDETLDVTAARIEFKAAGNPFLHDRKGDTFQRLSDEVAYLKLSSVKAAEVNSYLDRAAGTKGLIIDIRNYPSEFMPFVLGQHLVNETSPFVRFTSGDAANPGAFYWTPPISISPTGAHYAGKVVILLDEVSQSQAEYTAMAFRAAHAYIIGSTTAGADGNVSNIPLPGGLRTMISGIGVFYPDKRPTQRVGIVPDLEVKPTVEGLREGRDELLDAAIRYIVGTK